MLVNPCRVGKPKKTPPLFLVEGCWLIRLHTITARQVVEGREETEFQESGRSQTELGRKQLRVVG